MWKVNYKRQQMLWEEDQISNTPLGRDHSLWISGREKLLESTHVAEQLCTYMGKRIRWILLAGNPFYLYQLATHIPLHPKLFQL